MHATEDKAWWCRHGVRLEEEFVRLARERLGLDVRINPAKRRDKYAPDLMIGRGQLADLKTQNTPFFTAGRHGLDPRFTVTFNRKDYERYGARYPELVIFFWIDWTQTEWRDVRVERETGVYRVRFAELARMIAAGAPEHVYRKRSADGSGNALSSFLLDVRRFERLDDKPAERRAGWWARVREWWQTTSRTGA